MTLKSNMNAKTLSIDINNLCVCEYKICVSHCVNVMTEGFYTLFETTMTALTCHACYGTIRHTCASVYVHKCTWTLCRFSTVTSHTHINDTDLKRTWTQAFLCHPSKCTLLVRVRSKLI